MKRGFTLLELIIVIIILGVLATLGLSQYGNMVEKSRGAEARTILGNLRKFAAIYRVEKNNVLTGVTSTQVNLGTLANNIPSACLATHYFSYSIPAFVVEPSIVITAIRCTSGGKTPTGTGTIVLTSDFSAGTDTWTSTGPF